MSEELNDAKFRSLYVDLENGKVATPAQIAGDDHAMQRAKTLRKSIVAWAVAMQVGSLSS